MRPVSRDLPENDFLDHFLKILARTFLTRTIIISEKCGILNAPSTLKRYIPIIPSLFLFTQFQIQFPRLESRVVTIFFRIGFSGSGGTRKFGNPVDLTIF